MKNLLALIAIITISCSGGHGGSPVSPVSPDATLTSSGSDVVTPGISSITGTSGVTPGISSSSVSSTHGDTIVTPIVIPSPGKPVFNISFTNPNVSPARALARRLVSTVTPVDFEMGLIRGTTGFPFYLVNNGDSALRDVVFTSSNPKFKVTPEKIRTIGAPGQQIGSNVLVNVLARHGLSESGTGVMVPLITEDDDTTTVTLSGNFAGTAFAVSYTLRVTPAYVEYSDNYGVGKIKGHNCPISHKYDDAVITEDTVQLHYNNVSLYYDCVDNNPMVSSVPDTASLYSDYSSVLPMH